MEPKDEPKLASATEKKHRSRKRRGSEPSSHTHAHAPTHESFRGEHEDLRGWVYTYDTAARAYQYTKTTEAITKWVKRNLKWSNDITSAMNKLTAPDPNDWSPKARAPKEGEDQALVDKILNEEIKEYMIRKRAYMDNRCNVFTVVLGQCDEPLKAKLEGQDDWEDTFNNNDLVVLMKSIKKWLLNQQGSKSPMTTKAVAIESLTRVRQGRFESLTEYRRKFIAASDVLEHIGVEINFPDMVEEMMKQPNNGGKEKVQKKLYNSFLARRFLLGADKTRFGEVYTYLENEFISAVDKWPTDVTAAYNLLQNWQNKAKAPDGPPSAGVSFAQGGSSGSRTGSGTASPSRPPLTIVCYACGGDHRQGEGKCKPEDIKAWQELLKIARQGKLNPASTSRSGTMNHMTSDHGGDPDGRDGEPYTLTGADPGEGHHNGVSWCMHGTCHQNNGDMLNHKNERVGSVMTHSFNQERAYVIPRGSVGLDSMSSVDVFGERRLLTNVREAKGTMRIQCNAGEVIVTQVGDLSGYGTVWYHPEAIANILSLNRVRRRFKVTYNSELGDVFIVHRPNGTVREFRPTSQGLYASEYARAGALKDEEAAPADKPGAMMVSTVAQNAQSFTRREFKRASEARRLMAIVGHPSEARMRKIVGKRQLHNCSITEQDVMNAYKIFGPDVGGLKGKTTRRGEPHVELHGQPIPSEILKRHREVTIAFDVMFVCGLPFAVSISRFIKFGTVEALLNRKAETLLASIKRIKSTYARRGFIVNRVAADNEFRTLEVPLSAEGMALNVVSRGEHVPEVERHIRTLKERCRAMYNSLPYRRMPNVMIAELVCGANFWTHAFPAEDGVSAHISPRELVSGTNIDAAKHCVVPFGQYAQVSEEHSNSMDPRTVGAIALRPTGNVQGGHFFLSLETGKRIVRNHWKEVPATAEVISRVEQLAGNREANRLTFGNRNNAEEEDHEDDEAITIGSSSSDSEEESENEPDSDDNSDGDDPDGDGDAVDDEEMSHGRPDTHGTHDESDQPLPRARVKPEPEPESLTNEDDEWRALNEDPAEMQHAESDWQYAEHDPTVGEGADGPLSDDDTSANAPAETATNQTDKTRAGVRRGSGVAGRGSRHERAQDEQNVGEESDDNVAEAAAGDNNGGEGRGRRARKPRFDVKEMYESGMLVQNTASNAAPSPLTGGATVPAKQPNNPRPATTAYASTHSKCNRNSATPTCSPNAAASPRDSRDFIFPDPVSGAVADGNSDTDSQATTSARTERRPALAAHTTSPSSDDNQDGPDDERDEHVTAGDSATDTSAHQSSPDPTAPIFDATALSGLPNQLEPLVGTLLTQHGIRRGMKAFGSDGDAAVRAEMEQLHELDVLAPRHASSLTREEKKEALQYLMFLKRKRDGRVKGRGCADGRKQRLKTNKGDVSSPTIATESVFLILVIAAKEGRDVVTMDVPGAFLQTPLKDECVHVRFDGRMAELLMLIDPKLYRPNVVMENGKPVLYARLQKALYGMLQSALRFWEQVLSDLAIFGFETNPYDKCVANRTIDGAQQTVGWHVDDFLVTHVNPGVNEQLARWFDAKYGQRTAMAIYRGPKHAYLGMDVDLTQPGKVRITMCAFITETLDECPVEFKGTSVTPAGMHLFETDEEAAEIDEARARTFHHLTAKLLYLSKRARPDVQLAVSFLCTRVRAPDEHDWKKLGRVLKYLRGTSALPLTLEADNTNIVKWWVDAAFAVTADMRSHSGGTMSLGKGSVYSSSTRQRLNTRSSTEAELVGANDFMPQIVWTRYFLDAQGYALRENILYQDNQSAILLETNGQKSSGRRTRHINISYFFIMDRVAAGELDVRYCPTGDMRGDFFTKPLQGAAFRRFRRDILNLDSTYD